MNKKTIFYLLASIISLVIIVLAVILINKGINANKGNISHVGESIIEGKSLGIEIGEKFELINEYNNKFVIGYLIKDIDNDLLNDDIVLLGTKAASDSIFSKDIFLLIRNGNTHNTKVYEISGLQGNNACIKLEKITNDDIFSIIITVDLEKQTNEKEYRIYKYGIDSIKEIFAFDDNYGIVCQGQYLDDYKTKMYFNNIDKEFEINLIEKKDYYIKNNIYNEQGILKNMQAKMQSQFPYNFKILKDDNEKIYIKLYQRIMGIDSFDIIDVIESSWIFNNEENRFEVFEIEGQRVGKLL